MNQQGGGGVHESGGVHLHESRGAGLRAGDEPPSRRAAWFWVVMAVVFVVAVAFRVASLDRRPMHHDEANQAIRFGRLLETGEYRYDASEHHGPTLYYLTLPSAWLRGQRTTASLDEWTLRLVPALFGSATILLLLILVPGVGRPAAVSAAALIALAPPLTYYSRFYIQESLLLFFSLGFLLSAGRYTLDGGRKWALWAGAFAGLALATKETSWFLLPTGAVACLVARPRAEVQAAMPAAAEARRGEVSPRPTAMVPDGGAGDLWLAACTALVVAGLFYSSFLANPAGLLEPFRAIGVYLERGVSPEAHRQPWTYYLELLFSRKLGNVTGVDVGLATAALAGVGLALRRATASGPKFWTRCLLVYAAGATIVFSALPYKTPWNVLPFYAPWLVLAAVGAAEPLTRGRTLAGRVALAMGVAAICLGEGSSALQANFRYPADERNPYAYVHTSPDILRLAARVKALADLHSDHEKMLVAVVAGPSEQWPLPWYLRRMTRVGYWTDALAAAPALAQAPVVIASPQNAEAVADALGDRVQQEYFGLRPGVLLSVSIERSLWDRFIDSVR